ncbi:MAG: trigger factor [Coriobacteriia bacterium]|nr:trigger factor [Coriobacteriia bacterium]
MQTSVERLEGDRVKLTITVPAAEVDSAIDKAYVAVGTKLRIPGFRPGHAPRPVIDTHVGRDAVLAEAQEEVVSNSYSRAISQEDILTFGQPDVGELDLVEPGQDYTYTAEVSLRPELTLAKADDFTVTVPARTASDREVDAQIESTRERFATLEVADQPVGGNDFALISFVGTVDGEAYEGNTVDKYLYELGRGMMPSEFDAALVGTKPGASTVAEFEIPDTSSNEEFVGKQARFEIEVHEVKTKVLPELDDEFAASAGGFDSMEDYRADVRKGLDETKEAAHMREIEIAAVRELVERLEGDVAQEMIDGRANSMLGDFLETLQERNVSIQDYLQMTGITPDKLQSDLKDQAAVRVREELALEALFRAQALTVSESDMDDAIREIVSGDETEALKLRESLVANGALPIMREQIMHRKALKWLIDSVTVVEEEPS